MSKFEGKGVVVTGGASGIGKATVQKFLAEGAHVVISDINRATAHPRSTFIACDVADPEAVEQLINNANTWLIAQGVKLDILFNNAGIGSVRQTPSLSVEEWHRVIAVDLNSVFYACRIAIPIMQQNGGGVIVNTASVSGLFGDYSFSAYNAAKGAVVNYTRSLALDHGRDRIRVNALCPGLVLTGLTTGLEGNPALVEYWNQQIPLGRAGSAEEMANVVAFLASDDASYITGATLVADGGITARTGQPDIMPFFR
jgi:meso-butanediol dehydrogenase / (S,S)-butanediol dehydrogenase / diacetyl reductase